MTGPFAAILSDLDGVLVDSGDSIERTWSRWARSHGIDPAALAGRFHGVPSVQVIRGVAPHLDAAAEAAAVEQMEIDNPAATALPGAAELLDGAAGLPVAIVTSCTDALAHARLADAGLPVPRVMVTADHVRAGKPDPEGYRAAAAALGADPSACLVLEDAPAGIAAGRAAGATVIAIATTHDRDELAAAHAIAGSVAEALQLAAAAPRRGR
jgi:sugar-phosphatase